MQVFGRAAAHQDWACVCTRNQLLARAFDADMVFYVRQLIASYLCGWRVTALLCHVNESALPGSHQTFAAAGLQTCIPACAVHSPLRSWDYILYTAVATSHRIEKNPKHKRLCKGFKTINGGSWDACRPSSTCCGYCSCYSLPGWCTLTPRFKECRFKMGGLRTGCAVANQPTTKTTATAHIGSDPTHQHIASNT